LQRLKRNLNKGITMEQILKTITRATNPCDRDLTKSVTYLLRLNRISLISSLKSVIITAITEMNKLRESIMDSYEVNSSHTPNLTAKKKARLQRAELLLHHIGVKPFLPFSQNGQSDYNTKEYIMQPLNLITKKAQPPKETELIQH